MNVIKNFKEKNEGLFFILKNRLWNKNKTEDNYYEESSELLYLIEDAKNEEELSKKILSFYLLNEVNDNFSNYEEIVKEISVDYLEFLNRNNF